MIPKSQAAESVSNALAKMEETSFLASVKVSPSDNEDEFYNPVEYDSNEVSTMF
jgi:hypothetical protein